MRYHNRWMMSMGAMLFLTVATFGQLQAFEAPDQSSGVGALAFRHPDFEISHAFQPASQLPTQAATAAQQRLTELGLSDAQGRLDQRGGRWATLLLSHPLLPGRGVGNNLQWENGRPQSHNAHQQAAWNAFYGFLRSRAAQLRIDLNELSQPGKVSIHGAGDLVQINTPRTFNGIPVRDNYLTATVSHGNLVLFGAHNWGAINISTQPEMSLEDARASLQAYLDTVVPARYWESAELNIVPMARGRDAARVPVGQGYAYRLVWVLKPGFAGDRGRWEALVDAHSGEVLSLVDTNHYAEIKGGVLPVSNDGVDPDGVEQPGWPMPFSDVSTPSGTVTTDTGGNLAATGDLTSTLSGPYIRMNDNCGSISLTQSNEIDFGTSSGTDCTSPGFGGAGNTHASRTGFYELNKIMEMARGQLPGNSWLQQQLTANMNINNTCNAFWNGSTVNFYRSGGGCSNTGEIAGVFDHEWGHGMDHNDATPGIASPSGEGIADIYTALRLNDSCIGRNFRSTVCTGFGDPCLTCTGVRDIDYMQRQSGQPHDYSWSNANCGGSVHCVGAVYAEAVWSLWKRELQSAPYNYDNNTAHEIVNRLTFLGAGATGTWFSGGPPNGGCAANSGYMNYLAADDDNGDLSDGTPHMSAIYNAFNDQKIACQTPSVQDSGCATTPTSAPSVTAGNGNQLVTLDWNAVAGASKYGIYRTEGVFSCDFGKVKIGETTGTSWNDTGLQNGREYAYVVIPMGNADACFGPASACATAAPVGQPDFAVSCAPSSLAVAQNNNATATCTVVSNFGYTDTDMIDLSCLDSSGIDCSFSPPSVSLPADGSATSILTLSVPQGQSTGSYAFDVQADDGSKWRTAAMNVLVVPEGSNGPQVAVYDNGLGVPACLAPGSSCDSQQLADGRSTLGPESNYSNTLDGCVDGTSGSYHSDESNDRIIVRTMDGSDFQEGATVEIEATVWAWSTGSSDTLDLYYAADALNPTWVHIASLTPPAGGAQTMTAQYTLPPGTLQAVRANFRYVGSESPCTNGSWDDRDDLVFVVHNTSGSECTNDEDCSDGLYCNGEETCVGNTCQAGTPVVCDDGVDCTDDSCNENTDSCDFLANNANCDNGMFCDGTETCDAVNDCQAGASVDCNDSVACTVDSCNEATDSCNNTPSDAACSNGQFCDGVETCDVSLGCQAGPGDPCGAGETCDEDNDFCRECEVDADCDNGLFCDGAEMCIAGICQADFGPCGPGETCDEDSDACNPAPVCMQKGDSCTDDGDCCSNKCRGRSGRMSCK